MSRRKKRGLTPEDLELWQTVTKSMVPLSPAQANQGEAEDVSAPPAPSGRKRQKPIFAAVKLPRPATAIPQPKITTDVSRDPVQELRQAPSRLDKRNYDRLRKGKLKPERRIDLHGMRIATAQVSLRNFIMSAYSDELRVVLVITGKGRTAPVDDGVIPQRRGVIRQSVPHWLSTPPLRDLVVQTLPASDRHGGSGAFYVYLKRRR